MRAFLSDRVERSERWPHLDTAYQMGACTIAEREARRILGETEPAAETTAFYYRRGRKTYFDRAAEAEHRILASIPARYNTLGAALAESLTAILPEFDRLAANAVFLNGAL